MPKAKAIPTKKVAAKKAATPEKKKATAAAKPTPKKTGSPRKRTGGTKTAVALPDEQFLFFFGRGQAEGNGEMKDILGGKGAGLAQMTNAGLNVPPGFTISTKVCSLFYENNLTLPDEIRKQMVEYMRRLEEVVGRKFGDPENPLLVSVRSGAKFSMPGMMDTVLNLGLNDRTVEGIAATTGNERFAFDSYRRFIQMFGSVVMGIDKEDFEKIITKTKIKRRVKKDTSLSIEDLKAIGAEYKRLIRRRAGESFPDDPWLQLDMARDAVFKSWNNPRAITYRRLNNIPSGLGTAVNVQTMVFGNMGETSGTGVGFTRDPSTGEKQFYGEYLDNAQGEDVVAGIRTPKPIAMLEQEMPAVYKQLKQITTRLEKHYKDMQDFEFTIQDGELFMLQTRTGKRTVQAAVKIAVDMVKENLLTKEDALMRLVPQDLDQLLHPRIDPNADAQVIARGLAASPGAACGQVVFTADEAVARAEKGVKVILVRQETNPDDIHGMAVAAGILTSRGGMTSHAAVVARGMGKCCVAGSERIRVNEEKKVFTVGSTVVKERDIISLNGSTGEVMLGEVPTIESELSGEFSTLMSWADEVRTLGVRTNADTPEDAEQAIRFGAEGIGLCRTEHMFFAKPRLGHVQRMILADSVEERQMALQKLLPYQKADFKGIFKAMEGKPVTIRTLDPPLHEFLPDRELVEKEIAELTEKEAEAGYEESLELKKKIKQNERTLRRLNDLEEVNPMLGHRGCRLGITFPEITEMQARAIFGAACELAKKGVEVKPEVMIPLVGTAAELEHQRKIVEEIAETMIKRAGVDLEYKIGTMIEVPRAALTADKIAEFADFFSFGTNDLTQMTMGFSRDDAAKFLGYYVEHGILPADPFVSLDEEGIGLLIQWAVTKGKTARPDLKTGICGEHGGDPQTIEFCHKIGLDYVSCSPFRVPIARLAAAQATLRASDKKFKSSDQR
jgi:pyruvate,orthophosphate dikinase